MKISSPAMRPLFLSTLLAVLLVTLLIPTAAQAQVGKGSASFTAFNLVKIMSMEKHLSNSGKEVSVYVLNDLELQAELTGMIGQSIGGATLKNVSGGTTMPSERPDVIYLGDPDRYLVNSSQMMSILEYANAEKILTVTHEAMLIYKGVTLGIASAAGTPKFYINLKSSKASGCDWNKAVIKLAETI